jgi:hypothetical protein
LKTKERVVLGLFGLPFACVGLGFLFFSIIPNFIDAAAMSGWQEVPADLIDVDLKSSYSDGSTTYQVTASYRYQFNGRQYTGSRVGLNDGYDNIGSYHQDWHRYLKSKRSKGIMVYVNPDNPAEAIIDPEIRWAMVGFKSLFIFIFGGVGLGLVGYALLGKSKKVVVTEDNKGKPWLQNRDWNSPVIYSNAKGGIWAAWIFAIIWNGISSPALFAVSDELDKGNYAILFALLFPLVGLGILYWAIKATLEWWRFGKTPLLLEPYPGAIGGDVGGEIQVNTPFDPNLKYQVELACMHSYVSGSGKNRSRHESVVWQDQGSAQAQHSQVGTALRFCFSVPEDLPESQERSDRYHYWRLKLHCDMPGVDLNRQFQIPVFKTGTKSTATKTASYTGSSHEDNIEAISKVMSVDELGDGLSLGFAMGRCLGMGLFLFAIGLIFTVAGVFAVSEGAPFLFGIIFPLVGGAMLLGGVYIPLNRLDVVINHDGIFTRRSFLGVVVKKRFIPRSQISGIELSKGSSFGQTQYYNLVVRDGLGNKHRIGESFPGLRLAEEAKATLESLTGLGASR